VEHGPEPLVGEEVVVAGEEVPGAGQSPAGEDLVALQRVPGDLESLDAGEVRPRGDGGPVERAGGASDDDVGDDVALDEGAQHADLRDRLVAAAGQDECGPGLPDEALTELADGSAHRMLVLPFPVDCSSRSASTADGHQRPPARFADRRKAGAMLRPKSNPPQRRLIPARGREAHA